MKNFNFNTPEELRGKLFAIVTEAEKGARARCLPLEKLGVVVEAVASTPYGIAEGDGGHVAKSYSFRAETTYFRLAWYTQGKQKFVGVSVFRGNAKKVAYGANGYLDISATGKWKPSAWSSLPVPKKLKAGYGIKNCGGNSAPAEAASVEIRPRSRKSSSDEAAG